MLDAVCLILFTITKRDRESRSFLFLKEKNAGGGIETKDGNLRPGRNISCKVLYPVVTISVATNRNLLFQLMDLTCDWDHNM